MCIFVALTCYFFSGRWQRRCTTSCTSVATRSPAAARSRSRARVRWWPTSWTTGPRTSWRWWRRTWPRTCRDPLTRAVCRAGLGAATVAFRGQWWMVIGRVRDVTLTGSGQWGTRQKGKVRGQGQPQESLARTCRSRRLASDLWPDAGLSAPPRSDACSCRLPVTVTCDLWPVTCDLWPVTHSAEGRRRSEWSALPWIQPWRCAVAQSYVRL